MKLKKGQKISIDEVEMTCMEIRDTFRGIVYHFIYFNGGQIMGCDFTAKELKALGAILLIEGKTGLDFQQ
jgi:hypothetical protein